GILNIGLFEQTNFAIELIDTTTDDLIDNVFGLAFRQGLFAENVFFCFEGCRVDLIAIDTAWVSCGHMHGNTPGGSLEIFVIRKTSSAREFYQYADFARRVNVRYDDSIGRIQFGETAQDQIFTDLANGVFDDLFDGFAIELGRRQVST